MHHFCTYFDSHYLYKGLTTYRSLSEVCRNFMLWILCFDQTTYRLLSQMNLKNVELISLDEFEDDDLKKAKENRTLVEYFWTCTPALPLHILKKCPQLTMITYIDADLYFYSDPQPIFDELGDRSILLIEHRYAPNVEHQTKNNGIYNVQFMTFRNNETGLRALQWWRQRCIEWCYNRSEDGKMGDQKYLDDWPQRFPDSCILQNKGAGLAPWNIMRYDLKRVAGKMFVDSDELIFYHFHSFQMYSDTLFNLSIYSLRHEHKELIYFPYIESMRQTIDYIRQFDKLFKDGYSSFGLSSLKGFLRFLLSVLRGNLCYIPYSATQNR
jgi:hypothetical protein